MTPSTKQHVVRLGPVACAKLAALGEQLVQAAENVAIEVRDDNAAPNTPAADFEPSEQLLAAARLGIARIVCDGNAALAGVDQNTAAARLRKLKVPAEVAKRVADQLATRFFSNVSLRDSQIETGITHLIVGAQLSDER